MNDGFQLRLRRSGRTWPIDAFDANGITRSNERDAFPRSVTLEFDARSDVTRYRMNRVRGDALGIARILTSTWAIRWKMSTASSSTWASSRRVGTPIIWSCTTRSTRGR
jgi:hypothetical protein